MPFAPAISRTSSDPAASVRIILWIYFWLLILEGVLRKWVFPEYSGVLYVIRDPVAVLCYVAAIRAGLFPRNAALSVVWLIGVLSLAFALVSDSPMMVTLFGLRTNYLHLPLIFVMGLVLDRDDVWRFGKWLMLLSVPILVLMAVQFNSPEGSPINKGVGGEGSAQLPGVSGRIRPPGPFSFIDGVVMYFSLVAPFLLCGWLQPVKLSRVLLIVATVATVLAIPVSISRSLLLGLLIPAVFALAGVIGQPRWMAAIFAPVLLVAVVLVAVGNTVYWEAFTTRWQDSTLGSEGDFESNVFGRIIAGYLDPFRVAVTAPWFGHGIGLGTVAGARLVTGGAGYLLAEGELARCVLELGPFLGFFFIGWRVWLAASLTAQAWAKRRERGELLPWLLAGSMLLSIVSAQWGSATQLGFTIFGAGLALAALNDPVSQPDPDQSGPGEFDPSVPGPDEPADTVAGAPPPGR